MGRLISLEAQPYFRAKEVADQHQLAVMTPTKTAARALGKQKRSLQDFAVQRLPKGTTIASPLEA